MDMIPISLEQMGRIARYEETFERYADRLKDGETEYTFEPEAYYRVTLDDLYTALKNIKEKDPYCYVLAGLWTLPLYDLAEHFGLGDFFSTDRKEFYKASDKVRGIPLTEDDIVSDVWEFLYTLAVYAEYPSDDEEYECNRVSDWPAFDSYIEEIDLFRENGDKPLLEREFIRRQKKSYISPFRQGWRLENANETELELCRKFTEELAAEGDVEALNLKGYSCYGGNELYPCDWKASRDCMERLYDITDDAMYANTLGYIYYYGRCTNGEPEYEKAFSMFSVSAANGYYEGMYKLADMYRHGYACKKSPATAYSLYSRAYDDVIKGFISGSDNEFADAALRMGNVYLYGIGVKKDPVAAYEYYLQADYAAKRRALNQSFFGDTNVVMSIQRALDEAKSQLPEDYAKKTVEVFSPDIFETAISDTMHGVLTLSRLKSGECRITVKRRNNHKGYWIDPMFITYGETDYCELVTKFQVTAVNGVFSPEFEGRKEVPYDEIRWNYRTDRYVFYFRDKQTGWMKSDLLYFCPPKKKKPAGKQLSFASISFPAGNRTYDYLCDIPDIKAGDTVIVEGYDGETEVKVEGTFTRYESELGLPLDRYKKVIRKA